MNRHDAEQIRVANAAGRAPVVFVPGLWLLPTSWDRWAALVARAGFAPVILTWPDGPETVEEVAAGQSIRQVADALESRLGALDRRPMLVGHSVGALLAQILAGRGRAVATVAIAPAPFRGVLPLPLSALRPARAVPRHRAVPLTFEQFRYAFANAVGEAEARSLFETYAVPAPGAPIFQAAAANLDPWSETRVDTGRPDRGPLLIIAGARDHTVPYAIAHASYEQQQPNAGITEFAAVPGRGHTLTIDAGWPDVAGTALTFLRRFA